MQGSDCLGRGLPDRPRPVDRRAACRPGTGRPGARRQLVALREALLALGAVLLLATALSRPAAGDVVTPVPPDQRGRIDQERSGIHDAGNIRTLFYNFGMVGDYPPDPGNVDLSVFHSVEVPKGSGMDYSDGTTPFVLARITQADGSTSYIMETGYRERQGISPYSNRQMRFEPRPGYFEPDPAINTTRSPAMSNDPRTWPPSWPDRLDEQDDPGWPGSWNGYFGKQIVADQESYMVMDDQAYDAWYYFPDSRDSTRHGLGLRVEVRGFQWSNPQARNVIFWHYDIANESTTDYVDNIIFGMYMDSGVGGSALSCDGVFESDDDNAFFDRTFNAQVINLVYTWDLYGHGVDLTSNCGRTGYLGYAYLETPGNATDGLDNDEDGITDERRDGGPGTRIDGQDAIRAYVTANYDLNRFVATYGALEDRPAFRAETWWTGDEDMDWTDLQDVGADGVAGTGDTGEGDGIPTEGEPNFDRTDLNESDQIGLTGFKINRIRPGQNNPSQDVDNILFFTTPANWPERLYNQFSAPDPQDRFDPPLTSNYNIGFLFASGPFTLRAGQRERFSLALAYGADLNQLRRTVQTVQTIYNANYRFAVPPKEPTLTAEVGDGFVRLSWNDVAEQGADPVTGEYDFEGYRIYRSTDPEFRDPRVNSAAGSIGNGEPIAQFDLVNDYSGFSEQVVDGIAYFLGTNNGITHTWTDYSVTNGQEYYYAVTAYDHGSPPTAFDFYPSENPITVSRKLRGVLLPENVVVVRPNPRVAGFVPATTDTAVQIAGRGTGQVAIEVVNSGLVPDNHLFKITFATPSPDSIRARSYALMDSTMPRVIFEHGRDFIGLGSGSVGGGLLPVIETAEAVAIDTTRTGFVPSGATDAAMLQRYLSTVLPINLRRPGFPDDISIVFYDTVVDTSLQMPTYDPLPARFQVIAHTEDGDQRLRFRFRDFDHDGTFSFARNDTVDYIDIITYTNAQPTLPRATWRIQLDPGRPAPQQPPAAGDVYELRLNRPFSADDVFVFTAHAERVDQALIKQGFEPYVVPNPYVGSASFEPERFAVSGRGERRLEFRGLPSRCTIRIYNVKGELVQSLRHDGSDDGFVAWNLRTKDNLDVAPGLYIYHVQVDDAQQLGQHVGKFAIIK